MLLAPNDRVWQVKHRAANTVDTKLEEAQLRLVELAKELVANK